MRLNVFWRMPVQIISGLVSVSCALIQPHTCVSDSASMMFHISEWVWMLSSPSLISGQQQGSLCFSNNLLSRQTDGWKDWITALETKTGKKWSGTNWCDCLFDCLWLQDKQSTLFPHPRLTPLLLFQLPFVSPDFWKSLRRVIQRRGRVHLKVRSCPIAHLSLGWGGCEPGRLDSADLRTSCAALLLNHDLCVPVTLFSAIFGLTALMCHSHG